MTDPETRANAVLMLIAEHTRINCATPETARAALIAEGIYMPNGDLAPEFGGPPTAIPVDVAQVDRDFRSSLLKHIIETLDRPCSDGDMIDERQDALDTMIAHFRITALETLAAENARLRDALEPLIKWSENALVQIEGEWGSCRELDELDADTSRSGTPSVIRAARAALSPVTQVKESGRV